MSAIPSTHAAQHCRTGRLIGAATAVFVMLSVAAHASVHDPTSAAGGSRYAPAGALDGKCEYGPKRRGEEPGQYVKRHWRPVERRVDIDCVLMQFPPAPLRQFADKGDDIAAYALAVTELPDGQAACSSPARAVLVGLAAKDKANVRANTQPGPERLPDPAFILGYIAEICDQAPLPYTYFFDAYSGGLLEAELPMRRTLQDVPVTAPR